MARRQRLSEPQIVELFEPPTEQRELVRHYTLSDADLVAIRRCRGDHNRLGYVHAGSPRTMPSRLRGEVLAFRCISGQAANDQRSRVQGSYAKGYQGTQEAEHMNGELQRLTALRVLVVYALLALAIVAALLATPRLQRSYVWAVLHGKCDAETKPIECLAPTNSDIVFP